MGVNYRQHQETRSKVQATEIALRGVKKCSKLDHRKNEVIREKLQVLAWMKN